MRHIVVDGARLATWDHGGAGPALIALHAGVADSRIWEGCVPTWTDSGWRVITYDRRGFGQSTWEEQPFSHVGDLLAVMDALDVGSAVLVGSSQGGRVTLDTALDHPERVDGMVLIGPAITGAPYPFGAEADPAEEALDEAADAAEDPAEANRLEAHLWLDGPLQAEGRVGGAARELFLDMNGIALAAADTGEVSWGAAAWPRVADIAVPTQVMIGRHDMTLINEWSREVAGRIPSASLVELPDSAHLPMLDDPQRFLAATEPFLAAVLSDLQASGASPPNPA